MASHQQVAPSPQNEYIPSWVQLCRRLWQGLVWIWVAIILSISGNVFSSWLITSSFRLTNTPLGWLIDHSTITLVVAGTFLALTVLTWAVTVRYHVVSSPSLSPTLDKKNRTRMLELLWNTYDTMLTQTLEQNVWMDVTLSEKSDAVQNAATFLLRVGKQPDILLPVGTTIIDIYDRGGAHDLLILGEPGTGKSTLLLKLAQQLVTRAEGDSEHPLPVILSLSSWKVKRSSLQDWMIDEIVDTYHVSHQVSEQWVRAGMILPLLDGFDEMDEDTRPMGITEINRYHTHQVYIHIPLVVCSRTDAYDATAQHKRLFLQRVVVVRSLTNQQVDVYLLQAGKPVAALRSAIKKNPTLQKLATTPLMLSVLMHTYQGTVVRELPRKQAMLEQEVWSDYITRMVQRKGKRKGVEGQYSLEQTRRWLIYLAQQLQTQKQSTFSVEHMQMDWLPTQQRVLYQWSVGLSTGLGAGLILGLGLGLDFGLFFGIFIGLIVGLVLGLGTGLLVGLAFGLQTKIEPVEVLTWSWKNLRLDIRIGLYLLLFITLGVGLGQVRVYAPNVVAALVILLFILLTHALNRGSSTEQLPDRKTLSPNEGIRYSIKNGFVILVARLVLGLGFGLGFALDFGPRKGLVIGLGFGLGFGVVQGLFTGWGAALQHYILRFWLWRSHTFPFKVVTFLNDAATRFLLKRQFGGYSFSHELLQNYFTSIKTTQTSAIPHSSTQTQ